MEEIREDKKITMIYSYYDSPLMFNIHQKEWMNYSKEYLNRLEIIVIDDCSQNLPAKDAIILPKGFPFCLYRVGVDIPWNWRTCRNIGVHESSVGCWLFITDMDLLLPKESLEKLFKLIDGKVDKNKFYTFDRVIAPDMIPYKNHPNTYFLHRSLYLVVGGYDECVSGIYGLDGVFRRQLERNSKGASHLDGCRIVLYQRDYVSDASVSTLSRKENRDTKEVQEARDLMKQRIIKGIRPDICTLPYERLI